MDSFTKFAQSSRSVSGGKISPRMSGGARKSSGVTSIFENMTLFGSVFGLTVLFLLLTPGFLVNVPPNSKSDCQKLAPLPNTCTGTCTDAGVYTVGTSDNAFCTAATLGNGSATTGLPCNQQAKCHKFWVSGYTSLLPIFIHTLVFAVLVYIVFVVLGSNQIIVF